MVIKILARVDLTFLKFKMRIESFVLWSPAREVFGHTSNTVWANRFTLKAFDVGFGQTGSQLSILPKRIADGGPTRFGSKINLRVERDANPYCQIFPTDNIRKLFHQFSITNCRKAQGFTPLRKISGIHRKDIATEMVAWVRSDGHRNAKPGLFGEMLEFIVPDSDGLRFWNLPEIEMVHLLIDNLGHSSYTSKS